MLFITEKLFLHSGHIDPDSDVPSGFFSSPHFPFGYGAHSETYLYVIKNVDGVGFIRLGFDDWDLSNKSTIKVSWINPLFGDVAFQLLYD